MDTNIKHDYNLEKYSKSTYFFIPGAFESVRFISKLTHNINSNILLKDNANIGCVYGNVTMVWNGGRAITNLYFDRVSLEQIFVSYAELGIPVRFVCTNENLNEYDLHDRYANFVFDIFSQVPFEVVVNDVKLEDYLRNKYTTAQFISSTTKCIKNFDSILNELNKDYKYVCLDYSLTKDLLTLKAIPEDLRDKVEILINERCLRGCKIRKEHYSSMSKAQHEFNNNNEFFAKCPIAINGNRGFEKLKNSNYVFNHQIEQYLELGYSHFKLEGRANKTQHLAAEIMPYIIHPNSYIDYIAMIDEGYNNFQNM